MDSYLIERLLKGKQIQSSCQTWDGMQEECTAVQVVGEISERNILQEVFTQTIGTLQSPILLL